jgi:hypothetical protein
MPHGRKPAATTPSAIVSLLLFRVHSRASNVRIGALPSSPLLRMNLPRRLFGWMVSN